MIMGCFIKKIFDKKTDESVHLQFQKFSRGEFDDRAMIRTKNSKGQFNMSTTAEYARDLVITLAENLGKEKTLVEGALVSAIKLDGFDYKEKKSAIGVNKYIIEKEMTGDEIIELANRFPKAFFALSFNTKDSELKIQVKSPKSAKGAGSAKGAEKAKIDFCNIKTNNKGIIDEFIFDNETKNFKNIEIKHKLVINEIVIPPELKNEKDFAKVREGALRKGRLIRQIKLDDNNSIIKKEVDFEA